LSKLFYTQPYRKSETTKSETTESETTESETTESETTESKTARTKLTPATTAAAAPALCRLSVGLLGRRLLLSGSDHRLHVK
jgi:hypothetical protein